MEWNVFVDAKFGDVFVTRDNRKVVYFARCQYEGKEGSFTMHKVSDGWIIYLVRDDGISKLSGEIGDNDVISRYHEPIDENIPDGAVCDELVCDELVCDETLHLPEWWELAKDRYFVANIKERADAKYPISNDDYEECIGYYSYADLKTDECNAYIKGAIEQNKIDVDKALVWLKDNGCISYLKEGNQMDEDIVNMFRKVMKE